MKIPRGTRRLLKLARASNRSTRTLIAQASSGVDVQRARRLIAALEEFFEEKTRETKQMELGAKR